MTQGITFEDGRFGLRAVLDSTWSESLVDLFHARAVSELEINHAKGWKGTDLFFLKQIPQLRSLIVIDFRISSVDPIHFHHQLQNLEVITYCKTPIKFYEFPGLKSCALEWRRGAESLFESSALKDLFINNYTGKDTEPFAHLHEMESLSILNAPVEDLHGIGSLKKLRSLRLANLKRLTSLAGIERLMELRELEVHTCRSITTIDEIGHLLQLKKLHLNNNGNIASLKPLEKLAALQSVMFYESTNIVDGDLWPLARQKNLTNISFRNRRHYTHKREDFGAAYEGDVHSSTVSD